MLPLLILAVIATPLVEIAVLSQLLVWAPWPLVVALVVVGTVTGLVVLRQDGLAHLQRWRTAHRRAGAADATTITEGLRDVAGVLLAVPGAVTTVLGVILLAYPLRRFVAARVVAQDRRRRRRRLPPQAVDPMAALPPAPHPRALEPPLTEDVVGAGWEAPVFAQAPAGTGHIAGQTAAHGAVADTFFEPAPDPTPSPAMPPALKQPIPPQAPLPAGVAPAPPLPPVLPPPQPTRTDEWGEFMQGSAWEDEPQRKRRGKRRRTKGGDTDTTPGGDQ